MFQNLRAFATAVAGLVLIAGLPSQPAFAQGSPWIAEPGTGTISLTYANQSAKEFWHPVEGAVTKVTGPLGETDASLAQNTMWFAANYAVNDFLALDIQSAFASSSVTGGVGPSGRQESYSGLFDSNIALTFRLVDELISDAPSVAVRIGGILAGAYDTGYINSLGDGAHGLETSVIVGKFGSAAGFSAELGFRIRGATEVNTHALGVEVNTQGLGGAMASGENVDVPNDIFVNLGLFIPAGNAVTLGVDYRMVNALSGIDISGRGFSPSRFPGVQEDIHLVGGRVLIDATDTVNVNVFFGQVLAGNNTAVSRVFATDVGFSFGGGDFEF